MKKILALLLALALCFGITACAGVTPDRTSPSEVEATPNVTTKAEPISTASIEETKSVTYTYKAEPMQNAECVYYGPNDYIPNSPDPSKVQGKIKVWSQCPNCGEDNIGSYTIDPTELDFSIGDSIMYSDTSSCWDCSWDKDIDQFMWTIRITRIPE